MASCWRASLSLRHVGAELECRWCLRRPTKKVSPSACRPDCPSGPGGARVGPEPRCAGAGRPKNDRGPSGGTEPSRPAGRLQKRAARLLRRDCPARAPVPTSMAPNASMARAARKTNHNRHGPKRATTPAIRTCVYGRWLLLLLLLLLLLMLFLLSLRMVSTLANDGRCCVAGVDDLLTTRSVQTPRLFRATAAPAALRGTFRWAPRRPPPCGAKFESRRQGAIQPAIAWSWIATLEVIKICNQQDITIQCRDKEKQMDENQIFERVFRLFVCLFFSKSKHFSSSFRLRNAKENKIRVGASYFIRGNLFLHIFNETVSGNQRTNERTKKQQRGTTRSNTDDHKSSTAGPVSLTLISPSLPQRTSKRYTELPNQRFDYSTSGPRFKMAAQRTQSSIMIRPLA